MRVPDVAAGAFTAGSGLFPTDVAVQADGDFRKRLDASRQETGCANGRTNKRAGSNAALLPTVRTLFSL